MVVTASVKYRIRHNNQTTTHYRVFSMAGAYAGKTESAVIHYLKEYHSNKGDIIINSIEWR